MFTKWECIVITHRKALIAFHSNWNNFIEYYLHNVHIEYRHQEPKNKTKHKFKCRAKRLDREVTCIERHWRENSERERERVRKCERTHTHTMNGFHPKKNNNNNKNWSMLIALLYNRAFIPFIQQNVHPLVLMRKRENKNKKNMNMFFYTKNIHLHFYWKWE